MPKVPKQKVKIKKGQTIHPNSRKASALHRENNKSEHRLKMKGDRRDKDKHIWEKVCWFKEQLTEGKERYSVAEVCDLISIYINRFEERKKEIEQADIINKQLGRRGLTNAAETSAMQMVYDKERGMFESGHFEAPDLTNRAMVKIIREMGDELKELQKVKMRKFKQPQQGQQRQEDDDEQQDDVEDEMDVADDADAEEVEDGGSDSGEGTGSGKEISEG